MPGTPLAHPCASGEGVGGDGWSVEWEPTFGFPSLSAAVMAWVESNRRRVVNGSRELDLEISKARQLRRPRSSRHPHTGCNTSERRHR